MHDELAGQADSRIDLNRAGTPLLEIVSQPDMRSPAEAKAYLTELKLLLDYLGVSDCNMQEGSLRVDANVNLHIHDCRRRANRHADRRNQEHEQLPRRRAGDGPTRPSGSGKSGSETGQKLGDVPKQTRGWDDVENITRGQRHKEESSDYRYFPDPDLVPVTVSAEKGRRGPRRLGRTAGGIAGAIGSDLWHHALRQRRARQPGSADGRLLPGRGRSDAATASWPAIGCSKTFCGSSRRRTSRSRASPSGRQAWSTF